MRPGRLVDMDFLQNDNQAVSAERNAPYVVFDGTAAWGAECANCAGDAKIKVRDPPLLRKLEVNF